MFLTSYETAPKLLDFGIACLGEKEKAGITKAGQVLMTPEYAAPEQFMGQEAAAPSDIYALGLVLLELLTGRRPGQWGRQPLEEVTRLIAEGRPRSKSNPSGEATITGALNPGQHWDHDGETLYLGQDDMETVAKGPPSTDKTTPIFPSESTPILECASLGARGMQRPNPVEQSQLENTLWKGEPVPEALGHVLRTALSTSLEYRFTSCSELIAGIDRVLAALPDRAQTGESIKKVYDAMVWYHPDDRVDVSNLASLLKEQGLTIWFDVWFLGQDRDMIGERGKALDASHSCLIFKGPGTPPWKLDTATRDRLAFRSGDLHILPVLLPGAAFPDKQSLLPSVLRSRVWTTFPNGFNEEQIGRLARSIRNIRGEGEEELSPTGVCPFRGLEVFREEDQAFFFGREATSQQILEYLVDFPFMGVLGPSGSGKSSVVRAGVMPHLAQAGFSSALLTPTAHPLEELAFHLGALFRESGRECPTEYLLNRLRGSVEALHFIVRELFEGQPEGRLCLVVDQFEEVFTLAEDGPARDRFVALLCYALEQQGGKLSVLITMRSDFLGKNVIFPDLNNYLLEHSLQVMPMGREDLAQVIEMPVRLAGLRLEAGLLDRILDDVTGAAGELPLLEHALLELYEGRKGGLLTWQAYEEIGGIEGALARRAETEYAALDEAGHTTLRKMFTLCLVHPGEGVEDTRRRATRAELLAVGSKPALVEDLLDRWMSARLLTGSRDEARNLEMVDVAHEALIRKWDRIRAWMTEDRETARRLGQLRRETRAWDLSGRDADLLLRGGPLLQMQDLVGLESANLGSLERSFVAAGFRQMRRRRNLAVLAGAMGFVLAAIAFVLFFTARAAQQRASAERATAIERTREGNYNLAMMFDEKAGVALAENRPQQAWLYTMAAMSRDIPEGRTLPRVAGRFADPDLSEAGRMLWSSPVAIGTTAIATAERDLLALAGSDYRIRLLDTRSGASVALLSGHTNLIHDLVFSPQGDLLASASADGDVRLWQQIEGQWTNANAPVIQAGGEVFAVAFSPAGTQLVTASVDGLVELWNLATGVTLSHWVSENLYLTALALSKNGKWLAFGGKGTTVSLVNLAAGKQQAIDLEANFGDLCFVAGQLVVGDEDGRLVLIDPHDRLLRTIAASEAAVVALAPLVHSGEVAVLDSEGGIQTLDLEAGTTIKQWTAFRSEEEDKDDDEEEQWVRAGLAVSADGKILTALHGGFSPKCWKLADGSLLAGTAGHSQEVLSVAYSPDGTLFATASGDHTVGLWDATALESVATFSDHSSDVLQLAFSPDGRILASASADATVKLWDLGSRTLLATLWGHSSEVNGLAFSPDGQLLASASADETTLLWNLATHEKIATLSGHSSDVFDVAFSPDGRLLATASGDETIKLWRLSSRTVVATLKGHEGDVVDVAFSPDGKTLASASDDQTIKLWSLPGQGANKWPREAQTLLGHDSDVARVAFSPDGKTLASASNDLTILLWDLASGEKAMALPGHASAVTAVAFSPDGQTLISASEDRTVRLWDVSYRKEKAILEGHDAPVMGVAFSPDGKILASTSEDQTVRLWDVAHRKPLHELRGHTADVSGLAFSPDGQVLASASDDQTVRLWDVTAPTAKSPAVLSGHSGEVISVAFSPDGKTLASASDDQTVRLWNPADGQPLGLLEGHSGDVVSVVFSPDGQTLASASDDQTIRLWNLAQAGSDGGGFPNSFQVDRILRGHSSELTSLAFSPDGRMLASGSIDQSLKLWDPAEGKVLATLYGHSKWVLGLAWSADGKTLASASGDGSVHLWSIVGNGQEESINPMASLVGHGGEVNSLAFSAGLLATASTDNTIRLWRPDDIRCPGPRQGRSGYEFLLQRSLEHFGYRLDGFQFVFEPRSALKPMGEHRFPEAAANADLRRARPQGEKLLHWLEGK